MRRLQNRKANLVTYLQSSPTHGPSGEQRQASDRAENETGDEAKMWRYPAIVSPPD